MNPDDRATLWFDRDGNPISMEQAGVLFMDPAYKRVLRTTVTDAKDTEKTFDVTTVWLGLNHAFWNGPPLIFETMVFGEGSLDKAQDRYATEEQARKGHADMVSVVAATLDDPVIMEVTNPIVMEAEVATEKENGKKK